MCIEIFPSHKYTFTKIFYCFLLCLVNLIGIGDKFSKKLGEILSDPVRTIQDPDKAVFEV